MFYQKSKTKIYAVLLIVFFITALNVSSFAQKIIEKTSAKQRVQWYHKHIELKENSIFQNLPWQFIGPTNVRGRMNDV